MYNSLVAGCDLQRMEEQFILRVPPSVAERIERLLDENPSSSEDKSLDLSFSGTAISFPLSNPAEIFNMILVPGKNESMILPSPFLVCNDLAFLKAMHF